ncbi:unnamed protein product [Caenorhabditis auriculariae]|uniref:Protein kinase domain-containing protein n=1 Tax=Caenorhabditis auriculariae TaxID=2777116 RepID=A0A8S1GY69_9PELO|nr:unnamed protein product [Caenorhabditis auriculariae]
MKKSQGFSKRHLPSHVFVARIYSTWQTRSKLFSVLQYPVGSIGDLFSVWRDRGSFSENAIRLIASELACALDFLHRHDVIYRDVKLENIVLDASGHVLLIDFGLAKKLRNGAYTNTICGTLQYMSPDVASGRPYSNYVDWWSLGVLLHVLFTGIYPYPNAEAAHHADLKFIDYSTPIGCSKQFGNLLDRILAVPLQHRLCSFTVFHAHPFFQNLSFRDVEDRKFTPIDYLEPNEYEVQAGDVDDDTRSFDEHYEFDRFEYFNDKY